LVLVVIATMPGHRGTGRALDYEDGDVEVIIDTTRDGYSVAEAVAGYGRCIDPGDPDWEVA